MNNVLEEATEEILTIEDRADMIINLFLSSPIEKNKLSKFLETKKKLMKILGDFQNTDYLGNIQ